MLDIKFIRENPDILKEAVRKKHLSFNVDELIAKDEERKTFLADVESLRGEQNKASQKMVVASEAERATILEEMKSVKEALQTKEEQLKTVMHEWKVLMLKVPNVPDVSVPEGESDVHNIEIRVWNGAEDKIKKHSFTPKNHVDLMLENDMVDFERGSKVAGFRGYFLKNDGVLLNMALWQHALNFFSKKGFAPIMPPALLKQECLIGTGYLPQGEDDLYKTQDNTYLSGTAEVGLMSMYSDEVLELKDLPKKMLGFSEAFRREAGSHGKDVKGLYRVHEFFKFEQLVLCEANHELSVKFHEELTANAEEFLQTLGIPYRVVLNCGGDLGLGQVKKYDIEVWQSADKKYGESHSASYFHDFQTRRLNISYKDEDGKKRYAHSLNNTAIATPRILISLVEYYQQEDGRIAVPEVLKNYVGKDTLGKNN